MHSEECEIAASRGKMRNPTRLQCKNRSQLEYSPLGYWQQAPFAFDSSVTESGSTVLESGLHGQLATSAYCSHWHLKATHRARQPQGVQGTFVTAYMKYQNS